MIQDLKATNLDKFIPGIYNYCDRLCSECRFSDRCLAFSKGEEIEDRKDEANTSSMFKAVSESLTEAMVLIEKISAENMHDVKQDLDEEGLLEKIKSHRKVCEEHEIVRLARDYWITCKSFLDHQKNITDDAKRLAREVAAGIKTLKQCKTEMEEITYSLNQVQWYMFFIEAKLQRAIYSRIRLDNDEFPLDGDGFSDADGSAKVAILAIDKSMECWKRLFEKMCTAEEVGLKCLAILERLKKMTLEEFPNAMQFVRPGFDEGM